MIQTNWNSITVRKLLSVTLLIIALMAPMTTTYGDSEYDEALQQTEDQWNAVRQTMQESKTKFDTFKDKYQEYEDAVFSQDAERGIELARKLFNLDKSQTAEAKKKLASLREMFNELDKSGIKTKLEKASKGLEFADNVAGEVTNVWEFSKKFDPKHAKDNPTYGLRLIGDLLKESASKMEKIPLVGQILGKWIGAYGEVAGDFANALDRLGKKIDDFRGGSLCGQLGYRTDQQSAFKSASEKGESCLTYFAVGIFPRMRGETYEGNNSYFLYDPSSKRGYFSPTGTTEKVYNWHERLLDRVALDPDWLASRSNSLKAETESKAREYYASFSGWKDKTDPGWIIIEKLGLYQDAYFYGRLDEDTFVANYILAEKHHKAIEAIMKEYEKHVLIAGTVYETEEDDKKPSAGAQVEFTISGKNYKMDTDQNGQYEILMKGKVNDAIHEKVTKEGFEPIEHDGHMIERAIQGQDYTLLKKAMTVVISGTVYIKEKKDEPAVTVDGATVAATAQKAGELGSATSAGDGSYRLTVKTIEGVTVTCTATKDAASGAATVTVTGEAHSGVDITLSKTGEDKDDDDGPSWIINVIVFDDAGQPLPGAIVTCTHDVSAVTTGADGAATIGPIEIPDTWPDEAFTVTLTPSIVAEGGVKVGGSSKSVSYEGESPSAATLTIPVLIPQSVTISGKVLDANGVGLGGTVVTGAGQSATTSGSGAFSIGPFMMVKDSSIALMATLKEGSHTFSGGPVTATFDGANKSISGVVITLDIETVTDVTISGLVTDLDGKPIEGAAVTGGGGASTTNGAGKYTLPAFEHKLGTSVSISATITDMNGVAVGGQVDVKPMSDAATAPTIVLDVTQEDVHDVTISGTVIDENGAGVSGAIVTAGSASTTSAASGEFSLPPIEMVKDEVVAVSAAYTDGQDTYAGGPVSATFDGTNTSIGGITLVVKKDKTAAVTVSGTVIGTDGNGIGGASVSGGGQTALTDGAGSFSLGPVQHELGTPLSISASVMKADGSTAGGTASVTSTNDVASIAIVIDLAADATDDLDSLINDLKDDLDSTGMDSDAMLAGFYALISDLDGIAGKFYSQADFADQRIRELGPEVCMSGDVASAITAAGTQTDIYDFTLSAVPGLYAELIVLQAIDPTIDLSTADAEFARVAGQMETLDVKYAQVIGAYNSYECDEDAADMNSGDKAETDADPDDVESGADAGGGVEVCGDGIDNDKDGEIDECDAGCCDKNVQVTVSDCGTAADDIFLVSVDGGDVGVTPKGAANTFNIELSPGLHTVRVTCLDDGGDPLGSDIGTACVSIIVYGTDAGIGGGELSIAYGGSDTVSFTVPEGPAETTVQQIFDGTTLQGLEGGN